MLDDAYFAKGSLSYHTPECEMVEADYKVLSAWSLDQWGAQYEVPTTLGRDCEKGPFVPSSLSGAFADWFAPIATKLSLSRRSGVMALIGGF